MTTERSGHYLKYALFCKDTEENANDELSFKGVIDLVDIDLPDDVPDGEAPVLMDLDVNLAFCIAGAVPGPHSLQIAIRAPGLPLNTPPPEPPLPHFYSNFPLESNFCIRWLYVSAT